MMLLKISSEWILKHFFHVFVGSLPSIPNSDWRSLAKTDVFSEIQNVLLIASSALCPTEPVAIKHQFGITRVYFSHAQSCILLKCKKSFWRKN